MIWHRMDELPEYGVDVLVYFADTGTYLVAQAVKDEDYSWIWWTFDRSYKMDSTDRWAYIDPPED